MVRVMVAEGDSYSRWPEVEHEIEELLLHSDSVLEVLDVLVEEMEASTPEVTYLTNTHCLRISLYNACEETADVLEEIGVALMAMEQHLQDLDPDLGKLVNPDWSNGKTTGATEIELTVRNADLGDVLSPDVIHEGAKALMTDEWFWDEDDLAPFGSDDAAAVLTEAATLHRKGDTYDAERLDLSLRDALAAPLAPGYWRQDSLPRVEPDSPDWDAAICIDEMTIAAALAQLGLRGTIDAELQRRARLCLERQLRLDVPDQWLSRVSRMLEILALAG
jgi:uncharacterized protein YfeS